MLVGVVGLSCCARSHGVSSGQPRTVREAGGVDGFSVTFVAANGLCLGGLGQCVQKCFSLDNKPKENDMSKRGRKRRDRRKNGANHGKRPNA